MGVTADSDAAEVVGYMEDVDSSVVVVVVAAAVVVVVVGCCQADKDSHDYCTLYMENDQTDFQVVF